MLVQRRSRGINHSHVRVFKNKLFLASASPRNHSSSGSVVTRRHLEQLKVTSSSRGSKVDSLLAQANPITCHSSTNRLSDRFLLPAERFTPPYQLLSDPTQIQQLLSCQENPRRRLWCEMNGALFLFCSLRLVSMPARCFISPERASLKLRRSLSRTRRRAGEEEAEDSSLCLFNRLLLSSATKPSVTFTSPRTPTRWRGSASTRYSGGGKGLKTKRRGGLRGEGDGRWDTLGGQLAAQ